MDHFFSSNRAKLKKLTSSKVIIISANVLIQKSLDQAYPFKQENNFWYLTGINEPDFVLVMAGNEEFLIAPKLSKTKALFDGQYNLSEIAKISAVDQILEQKPGWQKVAKLLSGNNEVATLIPRTRTARIYGVHLSPSRKLLIDKLKRIKPGLKLEDISRNLARLRMVKNQTEIEAIKKAVSITCQALSEALNPTSLNSLKRSGELEAVINFGMVERGASSMSFDPIIAQGKESTIIHYTKNDQTFNHDQMLLIDVGCVYDNYCSDISRTISFGQPTPRQQQVFNAVSEVQTQAFKLVKSGIYFKDLEKEVERLMGRQLISLGLIKKAEKKQIRRYYPHNVSHSLGLDVHDLADYTQPLSAGSVITIEPGIYIPEESIGVRLEDDVLVETNGCQVLSRSLPSSLLSA